MIIRNAIRCKLCGDEIESKHRHDYVRCRCGACAVDGGHEYLRRICKPGPIYTDLSIVKPSESANSADYQIGGATYHVEREFTGTESRTDLLSKRIVQEHKNTDPNDT